MIPKKLQIKNFLSYGPETSIIDFSNYHLICLSGKNGHGKSALLDAMTWAIWGQARKTTGTSKADEGLVHLGQKHMLVIFEFEVQGQCFKVRREFIKTKSKPYSALDFGVVKDESTFITMTDKTIKATQEKIEKTIGISYDSFINSAFLRQGQANEFSKKSAKERKEVLASILQLEQFEIVKKSATEKNKQIQQAILQKESIIDRINQDIEQLKQALQDHQVILTELKNITEQETNYTKKQADFESKKQTLLEQQKQFDFLQLQINEKTKQHQQLKEEYETIQKAFTSIQQQTPSLHPEKIEAELKSLQEKIKKHQVKLNKRLELKEQYLLLQEKNHTLSEKIAQQQNQALQKLEIDKHVTQTQMHTLQQRTQQHKQEIDQVSTNIADLQTKLAEKLQDQKNIKEILCKIDKTAKEYETCKSTYQTLLATSTHIQQKINEVEQKKQLTFTNQEPCCPLCEQNLSTSRKKFLAQKLEKNTQQLHEELATIKTSIRPVKTDIENFEKQIYQQQDILQQAAHITSAIQSMKKEIEHLQHQQILHQQHQKTTEKERIEIIQQLAVLQKLQEKYQQNPPCDTQLLTTYQTVIKKIDALKQTAQKLAYNKEEHEKDHAQMMLLETEWQKYQQHQKDITLQKQRTEHMQLIKKQQADIEQIIISYHDQQKPLNTAATQLTEIERQLASIKADIQALLQNKTELLHKKGALDSQAAKQKTLQKEVIELTKQLTILQQEACDYAEIMKALGKDGLQALLIEEAVPEIEQEANLLLAQLTNNQTQIFIESLRDLKKGGSKETLDIKISDAVGLRPYEMFSGGEAFRIDFALRIAISKLLARRAGTSLQTLIIDEGFGSQDEEGLQLIMDSIYKIQDNFAKVIVVSHLPDLKEQFPVHFHIQKKASGSTITISEQG